MHVTQKPAAFIAPLALISWLVRSALQTTRSKSGVIERESKPGRTASFLRARQQQQQHPTEDPNTCLCRLKRLLDFHIYFHRFVCRGMPCPEMRCLLSRSLQVSYLHVPFYWFSSRVAASWGTYICTLRVAVMCKWYKMHWTSSSGLRKMCHNGPIFEPQLDAEI